MIALSLVHEGTSNSWGAGCAIGFNVLSNSIPGAKISAIYNYTNSSTSGGPVTDLIFTTYGGSLNEKMRICANGNVGIGTSSPTETLHVDGNIKCNNTIRGSFLTLYPNSTSIDQQAMIYVSGFDDNDMTFDAYSDVSNMGIRFRTNAGLDRMRITKDGNVGFGTINPNGKLHIYEAFGTVGSSTTGTIILEHGNSGGASSIVFKSKSNHGSDWAYIQYRDSSTVGSGGESGKLLIGTENDGDDDIVLWPSGDVGIKTLYPTCSLDVHGTYNMGNSGTAYRTFHGGFQNNNLLYYNHGNWTDLCCKINGTLWGTSWIGASSSIKIKKDIEDLDDSECLKKCLELRPVKYRYIDEEKNKIDGKVYGFIAEECKEVLPEMVDTNNKSLIPNIYEYGIVVGDILTIEKDLELNIEYISYIELETGDGEFGFNWINNKLTIPTGYEELINKKLSEELLYKENFTKKELESFNIKNLKKEIYIKSGDNYFIPHEECEKKIEILEKISDTSYKINKNLNNKIFIYGKIDNNFHVLKKEYLHPIAISSIQELHRIIEKQKTKITELETTINMIRTHLNI